MNFAANLPKNVVTGLHKLVGEKVGFCKLLNLNPATVLSMYPRDAFDHTELVSTFFENDDAIPVGLVDVLNKIHSQPSYFKLPSPDVEPEDVLFGHAVLKNPLFRSVFQALAYSEWQFCNKDLPQKSHEERLTGHILSKFYSSLTFCESAIENLAYDIYDERLDIDFAYHDLSTNNREKITGADFGVILHVNLPDKDEAISCYSFQAKKFRQKTISLDICQLRTQLDFVGEEHAFTVFYDCGNEEKRFAPAVLPTKLLLELTDEKGRKSVNIDAVEYYGRPLSLFLLMEAENMRSPMRSIFQAKNILKSGLEKEKLFKNKQPSFEHSRVLTLSIGGIGRNQDLRKTQDLFSIHDTDDEQDR